MNPNNFPANVTPFERSSAASSAGVMNWFKFFQEERELWVQNISTTQLSMGFEVAPGHTAGVCLPIGSDPICVTNEVPFDVVKKSLDFRKLLNRVPAVMRLMTTDQAMDHYAQAARSLGAFVMDPETGHQVPNVQAAIEYAERERRHLTQRSPGDDTVVQADGSVVFSPPKSAQELMNINGTGEQHMGINPQAAAAAGLTHVPQGFANAPGFIQQAQARAQGQGGQGGMGAGPGGGQGWSPQGAGFANVGQSPVMMDQIIKPRVLGLCQQVSMQLPANQRMPADEFFREVKKLAVSLSLEDLQYIEAQGTYRTVKKWARDLQQSRIAAGAGEGLEDGLEAEV